MILLIADTPNKQNLKNFVKENLTVLNNHKLSFSKNIEDVFPSNLNLNSYKDYEYLRMSNDILNNQVKCVILFHTLNDPNVLSLLNVALENNVPISLNPNTASLIIQNLNKCKSSDTGTIKMIQDVLDNFKQENEVIIERYKAGFESLLDTLAKKMRDKLKKDIELELVKSILSGLLKNDNDPLNENQQGIVLNTLRNIYNSKELESIYSKYVAGDKSVIQTIAKEVSDLDWRLPLQKTVDFLTDYLNNMDKK